MKHPYLYGALAGIIVVGIFLTGYNYGESGARKQIQKNITQFAPIEIRFFADTGEELVYISKGFLQRNPDEIEKWLGKEPLSGGYNLEEIQK